MEDWQMALLTGVFCGIFTIFFLFILILCLGLLPKKKPDPQPPSNQYQNQSVSPQGRLQQPPEVHEPSSVLHPSGSYHHGWVSAMCGDIKVTTAENTPQGIRYLVQQFRIDLPAHPPQEPQVNPQEHQQPSQPPQGTQENPQEPQSHLSPELEEVTPQP